MLNNNDTLLQMMRSLGLNKDESKVYLCLLEHPMSHLELARKTGVNRSKVYRIADVLTSKSLITVVQDDTGKRLMATDPTNLEITLTTAEEKLKSQRSALDQALPLLQSLFTQSGHSKPSDFLINTYEGVDGFKQMLWNELKTSGEALVFGHGTIQDLVNDDRWAEKHRERTTEAGYKLREIINPGGKPNDFTKNQEFMNTVITKRVIDRKLLSLDQQFIIYNSTVAIYNWKNNKKVGVEIINPAFAATQRAVFEHFWKLAKS